MRKRRLNLAFRAIVVFLPKVLPPQSFGVIHRIGSKPINCSGSSALNSQYWRHRPVPSSTARPGAALASETKRSICR